MRIAVVGARGQLGATLVHEFAAGHETSAFGRADLDISDGAAVAAMVARVEPDVIVNAAAFTNVDAAEDHPIEALDGNAFGVRTLARAALTHGATLVHYSSDFVFDGNASSPYVETDPPGPRSVYAASKLLGEWFALDAPRAYVLRVESLFGEAPGAPAGKGSAAGILTTLKAGGSPKVFEDRTITPSYVIDGGAGDPAAGGIARARRRVPLRELRPVHVAGSSPARWRACSASSRGSRRCVWRTCSCARHVRSSARSRTPNYGRPASTCRRGRTRWRVTSARCLQARDALRRTGQPDELGAVTVLILAFEPSGERDCFGKRR